MQHLNVNCYIGIKSKRCNEIGTVSKPYDNVGIIPKRYDIVVTLKSYDYIGVTLNHLRHGNDTNQQTLHITRYNKTGKFQ